jgi:hypothetical protein
MLDMTCDISSLFEVVSNFSYLGEIYQASSRVLTFYIRDQVGLMKRPPLQLNLK